MDIKAKIIEKSKSIGFQDVKFSSYRTLDEEILHYKEWIHNLNNATMNWMERNIEKRYDVRNILPGTKSIIAFSYNYFTGNLHPKINSSETGKISRYAWGSDYHDIVLNKLNQIEKYIREFDESAITKSYVDTGPTLDKIWAVNSGLGWQGKNSLVISKDYGSYFFIGLIFTNLEISPDSPVKDYCGSCRKCIVACPTNAIIADKVIDSNKCISYWTIEAKPDIEIPPQISENTKNWIYGCDICQEVCPWNKNKPKISEEIEFRSRFEFGTITKDEIENLNMESFAQKFKKSPVKRLKLAGLKRNSKNILSFRNSN